MSCHVRSLGSLLVTGVAGCWGGWAPETPPHAGLVVVEWPGLVAAAARGDADVARQLAVDLSADRRAGGAAGLALSPALERLGGAVGADELVGGVVQAAQACGACHQVKDIRPPSEPVGMSHDRVAWSAVHALVFPGAEISEPVAEGPVAESLHLVWLEAPEPAERARRVLATCASCHGAEFTAGRPADP